MIFKGVADSKLIGRTIRISTNGTVLFKSPIYDKSDIEKLRNCLKQIEAEPLKMCPEGYFLVVDLLTENPTTGRVVLNKCYSASKYFKSSSKDVRGRVKTTKVFSIAGQQKVTKRSTANFIVAEYERWLGWERSKTL